MVSALVYSLLLSPTASIDTIQAWVRNKDIARLEAVSSEGLKGRFAFLNRVGSFGVGRNGWNAELLPSVQGNVQYVVMTTAITSQDYGEQVFVYQGGRLTAYVDEQETLGVRVRHIDFEMSFVPRQRQANIMARTHFEGEGATNSGFLVRLGDNYQVKTVSDDEGRAVPFRQAGGVVALPKKAGKFVYRLSYVGTVDRPRFSGAIIDDEVMLTNDYWWPMIGRLPATFTTKSRVPSDWSVVAQGELEGVDEVGAERVWRYRMDLPVSYLSYSAGKFRQKSKTHNGKTYHVWSREMTDQEMLDQLEMTWPVIEFFDGYKKYPFSAYGPVVTSLYGGGALEAYSYSTYGTGWLPDEDAHEPSHTWFGGILPNTYLNSFWNESFATFCEGLYAREGAIGNREEKRQAFVVTPRASREYQNAAVQTTGAMSGPIASSMGYGKGGHVLQQLEYEMGVDAMRAAMVKWLTTHPTGEKAEWEGFIAACGPEWGKFFEQWLGRPGWPEFKVDDVRHVNGKLSGAVTFSEEPYDLAVEVLIQTRGGNRFVKLNLKPDPATKVAQWEVALDQKPDRVSLDPFDRLLGPEKPALRGRWSEEVRRGRIYGAGELPEVFARSRKVSQLPQDLDRIVIVGHPDEVPALQPLLQKAGVTVSGRIASYRGTSVSLDSGAVVGTVEVGEGKWASFFVGTVRRMPSTGNAQVALVDVHGRFLRGNTLPRTQGPMVTSL